MLCLCGPVRNAVMFCVFEKISELTRVWKRHGKQQLVCER
jgi:hypothetical protein